jgi:hypothetical protein
MRYILAVLLLTIATLVIAIGQTERKAANSNDRTLPDVQTSQTQSRGVTVIQLSYYAKPGKADEVFSQRQHASDVLEKLGLPRGRVMRRMGGSDEDPDVMWECEFPDGAALDHFLKVALASSEFEEVRKTMGALIRKGERKDWQVQETPGRRR